MIGSEIQAVAKAIAATAAHHPGVLQMLVPMFVGMTALAHREMLLYVLDLEMAHLDRPPQSPETESTSCSD
jgi:hypothetical protein